MREMLEGTATATMNRIVLPETSLHVASQPQKIGKLSPFGPSRVVKASVAIEELPNIQFLRFDPKSSINLQRS
jgi:hypothetical protein